jgi:membrane protease YdiL (CAAX protease family)
MDTLLSNGLSHILASAGTSAERDSDLLAYPEWLLTIMAIGVLLIGVWLFRRLRYPAPLRLDHSPGRANVLTPFHILAPFLTALLLASGALTFVDQFHADDRVQILIPNLISKAATIFLAILVAHYSFTQGARRGLGLTTRRWKTDTIRGLMTGVAALPICTFLSAIVITVARWCGVQESAPHSFLLLFADPEAGVFWRLTIVLIVVVLTPIAEESFYRGLVQSMFRRYTKMPWVSILLTSIIFAMCHWPYWTTILPLIFLAALLGYNYERTGRLLPSIIAHATFNGVQLLWALTDQGA